MSNKLYGKIMLGVGGLYTVRILSTLEGGTCELVGKTVTCRARGSFRHDNITLFAGDEVILGTAYGTDDKSSNNSTLKQSDFVIDGLCERRNSLIRPPLSNLDYLFITMSAASPSPILPTVDKLICIAEFNKIEPVIVITKCELDPDCSGKISDIYRKCGFEVFCLSALSDIRISQIKSFILKNLINRKTAAFAGASGIGKSTLLNKIFPSLNLSTAEISRKIERGRHTTRKAELYPLSDSADCGYIADTPGFSMLDFGRFDFFGKEDLPMTMREFRPFIGKCKYTKCSHTNEDGCAVLNAVRNGDIQASRHESFCEIYNVLKAKKKW